MDNPVAEILRPVRGSLTAAVALQALASLAAVVPFVAVAEIGRGVLAPEPVGTGAIWTWVAFGVGSALLGPACATAANASSHLAALDPENDATVGAAVAELGRHSTLLVIAHRLQTVLAADQILVLREGVVAERGTHEELIAAAGTYGRFWEQRSRAAGWRLVER